MTFPISRQGLEQIALALAIGAVLFGGLALVRRSRGRAWMRFASAAGVLAAIVATSMIVAYTIAPNIPTPPVPFTARFAQNPTPDTPETVAKGKALYQANCAVCHGIVGKGDGPAAFTLVPRPG